MLKILQIDNKVVTQKMEKKREGNAQRQLFHLLIGCQFTISTLKKTKFNLVLQNRRSTTVSLETAHEAQGSES